MSQQPRGWAGTTACTQDCPLLSIGRGSGTSRRCQKVQKVGFLFHFGNAPTHLFPRAGRLLPNFSHLSKQVPLLPPSLPSTLRLLP